MNWGTKLAIAMCLFVGFILVLSGLMMTNKTELVSDDYYEQELNYQEKIDAVSNYKNAQDKIKLEYILERQVYVVHYPDNFKFEEGKLRFVRPSQAALDFEMLLDTQATQKQEFNLSDIAAGVWNVELTYKSEGKKFIHQQYLRK